MSDLLEQVRVLASGLFAEAHHWGAGEGFTAEAQRRGEGDGSDDQRSSAEVVNGRRGATVPTKGGYRWGERRKRKIVLPRPTARAGEMRMYVFLQAEMKRCQVSRMVVYGRLVSGKYPGVTIRRARSNTSFVRMKKMVPGGTPPELTLVNAPQPGELAMKDFVVSEAARTGLSVNAVYNRLWRKRYPGLEFRRVNRRVIFVKAKAGEMGVGSLELGDLTAETREARS